MSEVSDYNLLFDFRKNLFKRVLDNKTTLLDFVYGSFNFLKQYKIKPVAHSETRDEILLTYLYWHIHVERKVMVERKLIDQDLGSKEELDKVLQMYIKRRDQALRRLFYDLQEPVKEAYLIFEDVVEVILNDGMIIYTTLESLSKVKIKVSQIKKTINPKYIQAIKLK
jgi:hypothetical protein